MNKRIAGLLGAAAALTTMSAAQAAVPPGELAPPSSYAELLAPVANASAALKADDARLAENSAGEVQLAQYYHHHYHHHHYHHHHYHHHHYHHHHYFPPVIRHFIRRPHHHHYHH